ncbi:MAG: hypothetical protein ACK4M7_11055, partial [Burkholderiales bacterium]
RINSVYGCGTNFDLKSLEEHQTSYLSLAVTSVDNKPISNCKVELTGNDLKHPQSHYIYIGKQGSHYSCLHAD